MKIFNGQNYVEIKHKRFIIHPTESSFLRKPDPPNSFRIQYQVQNVTQIRKNQKVCKKNNSELVVENYPKINNQLFNNEKLMYLHVLVVNKILGWNLIKVFIVKFANMLSTNKNIRLIKKVRRHDHYFSTRLSYADKRIREIWMKMVNTTRNSTEDMIIN